MLVFWKARLVLLAVPKTGTTALEQALLPHADAAIVNPPQHKHCTVRRYRAQLQKFFEQHGQRPLEIMAVVREPVDWLGSWYRYRHRDDLVGHPNSTRGISFDDFVSEFAKGKPAPFAAVGTQAKFLLDPEGRIGVDHLFRYEAQDRLLAFLSERLNMAITLPRLNVSPAVALALGPEAEARLRRKCPAEFEVWEAGQG